MVQVPPLTMVTVVPDIVQTGVVVDVNPTARPEVAVAVNVVGAAPKILFERGPKVMVWLAGVTVSTSVFCSMRQLRDRRSKRR